MDKVKRITLIFSIPKKMRKTCKGRLN